MSRFTAGLAAALLACPAMAVADVVVRVSGDQVDVRATSAPLADVLDRLGRQTGMKIVYEGAPPRQPITVTLEGRSHAEAVLSLLEGQGLNFALVSDETGARVETLILTGTAGTGTSAGRAPVAPPPSVRRPFRPPPGASPDAPDPFADPAVDDAFFDELGEEPTDDGALSAESPEDAGFDPADPAGADPANAPAATPFIGGQPASSSASPFTPQPFTAGPFPPAPPGTPGAADPAENTPTEAEPPLN